MEENISTLSQDKGLEERILPEAKNILSSRLSIQKNQLLWDDFEDKQHATDLMFTRDGKIVRIAVRVRRYEYFLRFPKDFTIRCVRYSGNETELSKIRNGWGDILFYCFTDATEQNIISWFIGSLEKFRVYIDYFTGKYGEKALDTRKIVMNDSMFIPFHRYEVSDYQPGFVMLSSDSQKEIIINDANSLI